LTFLKTQKHLAPAGNRNNILQLFAHSYSGYATPFRDIYRVSQEECARLREGVPYVKVYRYSPKHLFTKLNGYGDNGQ